MLPKTAVRLILGFATLVGAGSALADDLSGLVRLVGNAAAARVVVTPESAFTGPELCPGDVTSRVRHLDMMVVTLTGAWQQPPAVTTKCFDPKTITIQKTSLGHPAVVGVLSQANGVFQVTGDDGKVTQLGDIQDGLKQLTGKKVILDVHQMPNPALKDAGNVVVTYSEFP